MLRAYSVLHIKDIQTEGDSYVIRGMATTPTPDRLNDVVEPMGATFAATTPLLWQHRSDQPVGQTIFGKPTKKGIPFTARLPLIKEAGALRDRVEEAIQSVRYKLVGAVSIGFRVLNDAIEFLDNGGLRYLETEIMELSLVTIPAQPDAIIYDEKSSPDQIRTFIKSIDEKSLAASGRGRNTVVTLAGVTAPVKKAQEGKMTLAEQLAAYEAKRAASAQRLNAIMEKSAADGTTLDEAASQEYDTLEAEVASVDQHLVRLRKMQTMQIEKAVPIRQTENQEVASQQRGGVVTVKDNLPPGIEFARYAMCLGAARGNRMEALEIAKMRYPDQPRIQNVIKAAIAGGSTTHITWASPLVQIDTGFAGDFVEFLRPRTILGKFGTGGIPSLRRVPFNVSVPGQTSGGTGYWVGEGAPKPVTKFDFARTTIPFSKVANIAVLTEELVRFSNPSAETLVRDALAECLIAKLDVDFTDPAKAVSVGISPASITNTATPVVATGYTAAAMRKDIVTLINKFIAAKLYLGSGVWIMPSSVALNLGNMLNALGQREFPEMSMQGGTFNGMPVIVSDAVATTASGSPTIQRPIIILLDAQEIWLADDGGVSIDVSREASLQMDTAPTNTPTGLGASPNAPTATTMVSMFQTDSVAIRAEREINWLKRRAEAVQYITNASYAA